MIVQAEISVYPLGTNELGNTIDSFLNHLTRPGLTIHCGNMSTVLAGEAGVVFAALNDAFTLTAAKNALVMIAKISNACPAEDTDLLKYNHIIKPI